MKEIVVISGKGGTGKTSITAAFAFIAGPQVILADCDVDASNLPILLGSEVLRKEDFYGSMTAIIDPDKCTDCGQCLEVCHFDAIIPGSPYKIDPIECEGCGYCEKICPVEAIRMKARLDGQWFISRTRLGGYMAHAELGIGTENSGKLVSVVKNVAHQLADLAKSDTILVDGPPGISCPVISSLSGATYAVIVTEPTVSGLHDLKRVYQIAQRFNVRCGVIVNKADLNKENLNKILDFIKNQNLDFLAQLPYDEAFAQAMVQGKTIVEYAKHSKITRTLKHTWNKIFDFATEAEKIQNS